MEKKEFTVKIIDLEKYREPVDESSATPAPDTGGRLSRRIITEVAEYANESNYEYPGPGGYLSASTISAFQRCPREVLYSKFERLKPFRPNITMAGGNATHKGLETIYQKLLKDPNAVIMKEEIFEAAVDEFNKKLANENLKDRDTMTLDEMMKKAGGLQDDIVRTLDAYIDFEEYKKVGTVVSSEQEFMFTLNGIPIYGFTDLVTESEVIDFKFSQKNNTAMRQKAVPSDVQIFLYQLRFNKPGALHILVPPAKKATKTERELVNIIKYSDYPTWPAIAFVDMIEEICNAIETGYFPRRGLSYDGCNDCAFKEDCLKKTCFTKIDYEDSSKIEVEIEAGVKAAVDYKAANREAVLADDAAMKAKAEAKAEAIKKEEEEIDDLFLNSEMGSQEGRMARTSVVVETPVPKKKLIRKGGSNDKPGAEDISID